MTEVSPGQPAHDRADVERRPAHTWIAGLDGLRALAVVAVVVFHFDSTLLPGGFLGVDLFFVISGYLITTLLLTEIDETGRLAIGSFYLRRIRRLLPSVLVLILVVAGACVLIWRDELPTLRGSSISSLFYVTNWWLIDSHQSYFVATGRPPMLQHLWSLAIEEQFYLIWPPALVLITGAVTLRRDRYAVLTSARLTILAMISLLGAALSTAVMALISITDDIPYGTDSGRVYFGTDTHSMGLLLGAAAAALSVRARFWPRRRPLWRGAFPSDVLGLIGLIVLIRVALKVNEYQPWLFRGGFLLIDAGAAALVVAVARRGSALAWVLERALLRWIGRRSYAIYLWHWPVAVVTQPGIDVHLSAPVLFALRAGVTLLLADLSYQLVEVPIRVAGIGSVARRLVEAARTHGPAVPIAGATVLAAVGALAYAVAVIPSQPTGAQLAAADQHRGPPTAAASASSASASASASSASASASASSAGSSSAPAGSSAARSLPRTSSPVAPHAATPTSHPQPATHAVVPPAGPPASHPIGSVSAFGDSVMLGAQTALAAQLPGIDVDAVEGRQARAVFADIQHKLAAGAIAPAVVIHTGDNGIISADDLAGLLQQLGNRRVVVLTDRVPRDWQAPNNAVLTSVVRSAPHAVLVDWYDDSAGHPDWFYSDGLHLRPAGAAAYAALVAAAVRG